LRVEISGSGIDDVVLLDRVEVVIARGGRRPEWERTERALERFTGGLCVELPDLSLPPGVAEDRELIVDAPLEAMIAVTYAGTVHLNVFGTRGTRRRQRSP